MAEESNPYYATVYEVFDGSLRGVRSFAGHEQVDLQKGDFFTVVQSVDTNLNNWKNEDRGWYEIPALFCLGDDKGYCLNLTKSGAAKFRRPYLITPTVNDKPTPFMVPFINFTYCKTVTQNGARLPEIGIVHPEFENFKHFGARYDITFGTLTSFHQHNSNVVGGISGIIFGIKRGQLEHQPLTNCLLVEWAANGCVPGLNYLMKAWDMKKLKTASRAWLKEKDFPPVRDEDYLEMLHYFGQERKNFLVPKGLSLQNVEPIFYPYSKVYKSVKDQIENTLVLFGLTYKKEESGAFQGMFKLKDYSKLFAGRTRSSAVVGEKYSLFRASFTSSFDFGDSANWGDHFKRDLTAILKSRDSSKAMDFFNDYGTHYIKEAVMGGRKESVFIVDYCSLEETSTFKIDFEANLLLMYKGIHNISMDAVYENTMDEKEKKVVKSGPTTTCIGGNTLNRKACDNDTAWQNSVYIQPYPIELVVKPFWKLLGSDKNTTDWLSNEYTKYLDADMDEEEIKKDLDMSAHCDGGVPKACYTTIIALPAAVVLIVSSL